MNLLKIMIISCAVLGSQLVQAEQYESAIAKARFLITEHQKQTQTPGIQVALMVNGQLVWSEGFGYSDLLSQTPVTKNTQFRIASVSKPVTSLALGKLMDQGLLDIDKKIKDYLPDVPGNKHAITSRQLAASTAGIRHYTSKDPDVNLTHYDNVTDALTWFINDDLLFEPGSDFHYSSYGWVLLSAVMEQAANKPFTELMQETWEELGMDHTTFDFPDTNGQLKSKQYISGKKGRRVEAPFENRSHVYAGGGYLSTAEDLVQMGSQLLRNEVLSVETRNTLFSPFELSNGAKIQYGLGWESGQNRLNTRIIYHSGSMSSARAHLVLFPDADIVFAYLANTGDHIFFNDREAHSIAELFVNQATQQDTSLNSLTGQWTVSTTSLRDRKTKGLLEMKQNSSGLIHGHITFRRSKKEQTFPVVLARVNNNDVHLIGVSPMFFDLYLSVNHDSASGTWLHDFNVNGTPESDAYWKARSITARRQVSGQ